MSWARTCETYVASRWPRLVDVPSTPVIKFAFLYFCNAEAS